MTTFNNVTNYNEISLNPEWIDGVAFKSDKTATDFTLSFPQDVIFEIFAYLDGAELSECLLVNKKWNVLANTEKLWDALIPKVAFGPKQWETHFGNIGFGDVKKAPPLPKWIHKYLKSPCPFWPEKKVGETHVLVLIPETIDSKLLNLETLEELVKVPKQGRATQYKFILDEIVQKLSGQSPGQSHWVLMTRDVIPGSIDKSYKAQEELVAECAAKTKIDYKVPTVLDATICIFMQYVRSGEYLFNNVDPLNYTRCQEDVLGYQVAVGAFDSAGLYLDNFMFDSEYFGVAAMWKLVKV